MCVNSRARSLKSMRQQGQTAEFATPKALLSDSQSVFSQMVDKMGPQAAAGLRAQCGVSE